MKCARRIGGGCLAKIGVHRDQPSAAVLARGIAQMMRVGLYRPVHVKTPRSQKLRMLLIHRKLLQAKAIAVENDLRATLRNFGLKVGVVGTVKFEARIKELVEKLARPGGIGRTAAGGPAGASRADEHPASPLAGCGARR
jgi:transposase